MIAELNIRVLAGRIYAETKFRVTAVTKPGRNQNASYGCNQNQAETKKFRSFGGETVAETEFRSDSSLCVCVCLQSARLSSAAV